MRNKITIIIALCLMLLDGAASAENDYPLSDEITDIYEVYFGPMIEAFPGELNLLIPIQISVTQPTVGVNILLNYDPSLLTPTVVAPNMFFQNFETDLSIPGRIGINLFTHLTPPPVIPPIDGDTIFAWISCRVTTEDIGYDLLTHFTFYEDPVTPYPDNNILLESGEWIVPPSLSLVQGDVLIISPLYGDINVNGFAYEIGDAITFLNYFMGQVEFSRRQYANSDCNRDGIQASISDLVYLMGIISGDTLLRSDPYAPVVNELKKTNILREHRSAYSNLDIYSSFEVNIECQESLGGAYFVLEFDRDKIEIESVLINDSIDDLNLSWAAENGELMVAVYNWDGSRSLFAEGSLFTVNYSVEDQYSDNLIRIVRAEFSNSSGEAVDAEFDNFLSEKSSLASPNALGISLSSYPNPFNGPVSLNYEIPKDGNYELVVYDILGREVKTLMEGHQSFGGGIIVWDGTNNNNGSVASGIYFARLRGETVSASVKLFMLR